MRCLVSARFAPMSQAIRCPVRHTKPAVANEVVLQSSKTTREPVDAGRGGNDDGVDMLTAYPAPNTIQATEMSSMNPRYTLFAFRSSWHPTYPKPRPMSHFPR